MSTPMTDVDSGSAPAVPSATATATDSKSNTRLVYGSLENTLRAGADRSRDGDTDEIARGVASGNIHHSGPAAETFELSESFQREKAKQDELLAQLDAKRRARQVAVPTNDALVKKRLRELAEPITLFGERAPGRRERLGAILARMAVEQGATKADVSMEITEERAQVKKAYLTPGLEELRDVRKYIAQYSIEKVKQRLENERQLREDVEGIESRGKLLINKMERLHTLINYTSQTGDLRPISSCSFAPNSKYIATASWTGDCKVWSIPDSQPISILKGHELSATDINFHPQSGQIAETTANIASCAMDGQVLLWPMPTSNTDSMSDTTTSSTTSSSLTSTQPSTPFTTPLARLIGHTERCSRLAFHPSGRYLGSTSYDHTWRLWDLETQKEVLCQRGHAKEVYAIAFQTDGALAATGDLGGVGQLWDLRTGKTVLPLVGHAKQMMCADFSIDGYHLATGSDDHTVRIWDLRKKHTLYILPAHNKLISNVRWEPAAASYLLTSSYDHTAKLWHGTDFTPIRTLAGHDEKVMRAEITRDGAYIATASYDRTWKLWKPEE